MRKRHKKMNYDSKEYWNQYDKEIAD